MKRRDIIAYKKEPSWIARKAPGFIFYANAALVVIAASNLARKGLYSIGSKIRSSLSIMKSLQYLGFDIRVENLNAFSNLKTSCVFVANHMSVLETFLFPSIIMPYQDYTVVLKRSLTQYPIFKDVLDSTNTIVVDRTNPRQDFRTVMEEGLVSLKNNISVLVFPQTTRNVRFDPKKFNTLGIKLARRAGVPVVPIAVKTDAWGVGRWFRDIGRIDPAKPVRISFGQPVYITGNGKVEHRATIDFIKNKLAGWQ